MPTRCLIAGLLVLSLSSQAASAFTSQDVQSAIDQAKAWLYSKQNKDGTWETTDRPLPGQQPYETSSGQWGGLTALVTYALLSSGENPRDPRLQAAIHFLLSANLHGVYAISLRAQVWNCLPPSASLHAAIQRDGKLLLNAMRTQGEGAGMYGYLADAPPDPNHLYDHSVSLYAVLGMWALQEAGLEVPDQYWAAVDAAWRRDQLPDGEWSYFARSAPGYPTRVTSAAGGVISLLLTDDTLRGPAGLQCRENLADPAVDSGIAWIDRHFDTMFDDPTVRACYALYCIERMAAVSGRKFFGDTNWYENGADYLLRHRLPDSAGWDQGDGIVADTALGMLFLIHGRAPLIMSKLEYSSPAWNRRPRDLAHLAHWVSRIIEDDRPLNWQTVPISGDPDDWHEAPILCICGRSALKFPSDEQAKLRRFVEDGGLILFNNDCEPNRLFAESVKELGRDLFHREFRELPPDHPIYTSEEFHRAQWKDPPSVLGLSNGARELMILLPAADLSGPWQANSPLTHPDAFELGTNIFLYAVDKEHLRFKGDSYLVKNDPAVIAARRIRIARLNYGDGWEVEPGGWRRLAAVMHNNDRADLEVEECKFGDDSLNNGDYQIAHLTGTATFTLSAAARDEIRRFVSGGGTLIIDAAGGSRAFADSARAELAKIFGDKAAQLAAPLPMDHPFYSGGDQKLTAADIDYRSYARLASGKPRLRAIDIGGRLGVFFSAEDLSVGLVGQPVDGIIGYSPESATKLMERIIMSAILSPPA
jgi:Domain of unknown function (DUF4159)